MFAYMTYNGMILYAAVNGLVSGRDGQGNQWRSDNTEHELDLCVPAA